ncbi:DUF6941 family protein [Facklamia sp. P12955]|uniref:DUF6941 family protein n=1 Tax=unclassified Facklamia TaxID=2622293 RepID=UPI003D16CA60
MIVNSTVIVARKQFHEEDGSIHLINPIAEMQVPFLPTTVSFTVCSLIVVSEIESSYEARVTITDKKEKEILSASGPLNSSNIGERGVLQLNINADDVIIKNDGTHICELYINEKKVASYSFEIFNKNIDLD